MPTTMYDDVNLDLIPADAEAVAGYVNGRYRTFPELARRWPHAKHLSIAVNAEADADCLDIERYDALPSQAPAWVRRQKARGVAKPVVYCSLADAQRVVGVLSASGIRRREYRLWTAHYTYTPHLCSGRCGFSFGSIADATQYTDKAHGRSLDASLVSDAFFASAVPVAKRRARLRAWIVARRAHGVAWSALKKSSQWKFWRRLGGK